MQSLEKLNVLIATYLEPEYVEQIRAEIPEVEVLYRPDLLPPPRFIADHTSPANRTSEQEREWQALLGQAHILYDFDHSHHADLPELAPNLRWIQGTSAGIGQLVQRNGYIERADWIYSTASGIHARPLAEFVLMAMLMFAKNYPYLQQEKERRNWARYCGTELTGKTLAIVGLGKIGRETARLAKLMAMRVVGNRRDTSQPVPHVDQLYAPAQIHDMLREANFLALSCPHTPETEGLIGAEEFGIMPAGAVLINISRGKVVQQDALIESLQNGHLGGAALDVTDPEPLPADSPLWAMPNVFISPHSASTVDAENGRLTRLFCDNLKRFLKGEPLINQLDTVRLY
jgi:phosphoglycerate dehydrogenase-like enzyme